MKADLCIVLNAIKSDDAMHVIAARDRLYEWLKTHIDNTDEQRSAIERECSLLVLLSHERELITKEDILPRIKTLMARLTVLNDRS